MAKQAKDLFTKDSSQETKADTSSVKTESAKKVITGKDLGRSK